MFDLNGKLRSNIFTLVTAREINFSLLHFENRVASRSNIILKRKVKLRTRILL